MTLKEAFSRRRVYMMIGVWLTVYPTVTLLTYLTSGTDWPTFVRTFVTTILTVPIIEFAVIPIVDELIAHARNEKD